MGRDSDTTIQELKDLVVKFREERDWGKHHTPQNLAMSISIEAAELLEHFQWGDYSKKPEDLAEIADEMGDILAYLLNLSDRLGIDVATAYRDKLAKAAKKYPVELFNKDRDSTADYNRIKKTYRSKK
jgi:dCTP diphosphatase